MAISKNQFVNSTTKSSKTVIFLLLVSRSLMFLIFQALIALLLNSWETSQKYWLLTATLTNIVSIILLILLFKRDGIEYLSIFSFNKIHVKKDILIFIGLVILSLPVIFLPGYMISSALWSDPNIPTAMMFGGIEKWLVYALLLAFPATIAFAELATYFVFIMPRLKTKLNSNWLALLLPVIFLSIQHCTLPFIPDINFIMYRGIMFLPFSIIVGLSIYKRPSLFPYFAILHGLMDFGTALMFLMDIN